MTNKENLDQLTDYIDKLKKLTENIYEREIYPVSFFSQAFDITNKIQDSLHQIEVAQIELFEKQMKEHQAQIRNIQRIEKKYEPGRINPLMDEKLPEHSSHTDNSQTVLSKTDKHITEKETIIENKKVETVDTSPTLNERLPETSSFEENTQIFLPKTDLHIAKKKETITKDNKTETTQTSPMFENQLSKASPLVDKPEISPSEAGQTQFPLLVNKPHTAINSLDKKFEKKTLSDLKKAFTLNDRFRFCRELFSSNEDLMNQTFSELNNRKSYNDSLAYIKEHFNWNLEDDVTIEFISMIEKRFN